MGRSRMNCVIERRRAEELVDNAPKMTPFGFNFNSEPKKRVTGERMNIYWWVPFDFFSFFFIANR